MAMHRSHTTLSAASALIRRARVGTALSALALIVAPVQAQTTGTIPVWVDPPTRSA
jgi:hypothetical protein